MSQRFDTHGEAVEAAEKAHNNGKRPVIRREGNGWEVIT